MLLGMQSVRAVAGREDLRRAASRVRDLQGWIENGDSCGNTRAGGPVVKGRCWADSSILFRTFDMLRPTSVNRQTIIRAFVCEESRGVFVADAVS